MNIIAKNLHHDTHSALDRQFRIIDEDGSGFIRRAELYGVLKECQFEVD